MFRRWIIQTAFRISKYIHQIGVLVSTVEPKTLVSGLTDVTKGN